MDIVGEPTADKETGLDPKLTKVLVAVGLFVGTMLCALIPPLLSRCSRGQNRVVKHILTGLSCLGGGIFLSTCLLHLIPEGVEKMDLALVASEISVDFPISYGVIVGGFLIVLLLEQFIYLLTGIDHGHSTGGTDAESDIDDNSGTHSAFRAIILVFALSLHSVFEGMAIGLQATTQQVLELFLAIVVHKLVIVVTVSTSLVNSVKRLGFPVVFICLAILSAMSPIGIGIAIGLNDAPPLVNGVLQCVAAGTFVYITFFEILPQELNAKSSKCGRISKLILVLAGVALMVGIMFAFPDKD